MFPSVLFLSLVCAASAQQKSFFDGVEELLSIHGGDAPPMAKRFCAEATSSGLSRSFLEDLAADVVQRHHAAERGAFMSELSGLASFVRSLDAAAKEAQRKLRRDKRRGRRRTKRSKTFTPLYGFVNFQVPLVTFRVPFHDFKVNAFLDPYPQTKA